MRAVILFFLLASSAFAGTPGNDATLTRRLVGTWQGGRHSTRYFADGTWLMDPQPGYDEGNTHGRWSIKNGRLTETFEGGAGEPNTNFDITALTAQTLKIRPVPQTEPGRPEASGSSGNVYTLQRIPDPGGDSATRGNSPPRGVARQENSAPSQTAARIQDECDKSLGKSYRTEKRVSDVQVAGNTIKLHLYVQSNLTEHLMKFGAREDIAKILKAVQGSGVPYGAVTVTASYPVADKFGNSREQDVVRATYNRSTVDRINWEGFLPDNIFDIADDVQISPVFR